MDNDLGGLSDDYSSGVPGVPDDEPKGWLVNNTGGIPTEAEYITTVEA